MTDTPSTAERMTRAEIRAQISEYDRLERDLLRRLIALEKTGGVEAPAGSERDQRVRDRARARLNGNAAQLLQPAATGPSISDLRIDLDAVRLILQTLSRSDVEAAANEALRHAEQLSPTESGLIRDWALTTARWLALTERVDGFYEEAGGEVTAALPLAHLPARACEIVTYCSITAEEVLAKVLEAGVVSAADLRKARSV